MGGPEKMTEVETKDMPDKVARFLELFDKLKIATNHGFGSLVHALKLTDKDKTDGITEARLRVSRGDMEESTRSSLEEKMKHMRGDYIMISKDYTKDGKKYESDYTWRFGGAGGEGMTLTGETREVQPDGKRKSLGRREADLDNPEELKDAFDIINKRIEEDPKFQIKLQEHKKELEQKQKELEQKQKELEQKQQKELEHKQLKLEKNREELNKLGEVEKNQAEDDMDNRLKKA